MHRVINTKPNKSSVHINNCFFFFLLILISFVPYLIRFAREIYDATTTNSTKLLLTKNQKDEGLLVSVLLQQSPVLKVEQVSRLAAIDNSWAKWGGMSSINNTRVEILAAIPYDCVNCSMVLSNPSQAGFSVIQLLKISAPISNISVYMGTSVSNPFYNLVQSLLHLMKAQNEKRRWLFLANDHTFAIVPNLVKFLVHYDSDSLIYSGNQLAIGMRTGILHFASGGAGAVLSVSCIRLVTIIWTALQFDFVMIAAANPLSRTEGGNCLDFKDIAATSRQKAGGNHDLVELAATADGSCVLQQVLRWSNAITRGASLSTSVNISLSSKAAVTLLPAMIKKRHGKKEIFFQLELYQEHRPVVRVDSDALRRNCMARDKWSIDNPGIILSMCLTVALRIPFTLSVAGVLESSVTGLPSAVELFNVYGPMRMVMEEIDDWYTKAKKLVAQDMLAQGSLPVSNTLISREVISFHYVNQMEAGLLYDLLSSGDSGRWTTDEVRRLWPSTNAEAGPYSRRLQSDAEAKKLISFLKAIEIS